MFALVSLSHNRVALGTQVVHVCDLAVAHTGRFAHADGHPLTATLTTWDQTV